MGPQCTDYQDRICHMKLDLLKDTSQQIAKVVKTEKHCQQQAKKIESPQPPLRSACLCQKFKPPLSAQSFR